jgi:hypothetical protein
MKEKYLVAAMGLLFLFGACEKDLGGGFGDGKKVEIFFSADITSYHTAEDLVRSGGMREPESRTMYINDSIYLLSTLAPDEEETTFDGSQLRATTGFMDGQKLCFAAYKLDGTQEGATAIYTYSTVTNKWTSSAPLGVVSDNSTTYRFVAYSNFGETTTPGTSIDLTKDLVWGSAEKKIANTEVGRTVNINMLHKFARVKVRVKSGISGVNITALSGVEIEGGNWTTFEPFDGSFGTMGSVNQGVTFTGSFPTAQLESGQRLVFPVSPAPTKVKVGTVKVSAVATTFSNSTVEFNSALNGGTSYVLEVDVKKCVWSRSNVYWQEVTDDQDPKYPGYLTFVPAGNDLTKQGYQGVVFKFGSLVGVSPAQTNGSDVFSGSPVPIYVPIVAATLANSTWKVVSVNTMKDDTDFPTVASNWTWSTIPFMDEQYNTAGSVAFGRDNRLVIDDAQNTVLEYQGFRGDICQYISKTGAVSGSYRLPTSSEFGPYTTGSWNTLTPNADGWQQGSGLFFTNNSAGKPDGTANLLVAADNNGNVVYGSGINRPIGDVVFPASGLRHGSGSGDLNYVGHYGLYWSGSTDNNPTSAYYLLFDHGGLGQNVYWNRDSGAFVRCVQKLD